MTAARVGLVLGAGGITGAAYEHGVLTAIAERSGWQPTEARALIGTSAGSWIAAFLARGHSLPDVVALARPPAPSGGAVSRAARRVTNAVLGDSGGLYTPSIRIPRISPLWWLQPTTLLGESGYFSTEGMARRLRARLPDAGTASLPSHLRIVAYDTRRLRRVPFGSPKAPRVTLLQAVTASSAIPGVFRPVEIDGVPYLDGGIASTTHLDLVAEFAPDLDIVICIAPMAGDRTGGPPPLGPAVYSLVLSESLAWVARRTVEREAAGLRRSFPDLPVVIFRPDADDRRVMGANAMNGRRREPVRRVAYASALRALDSAELRQAFERGGLSVDQQ